MKIIKPLRLSVLNRPFRWQQRNFLGISALALCDMNTSPKLVPEPELWQLLAEELILTGGVVDLAIPKAHAEFLATGFAYTHHQQDKSACVVRIEVEKLSKMLKVSGDRFWIDNKPSKAQPFTSQRLDWDRTYGGANFANNPHGVGIHKEPIEGTELQLQRLPNIEPLEQRLQSPEQQAIPSCFSGLDFTWPERFKRIGKKYDAKWLEHEFPGFARDIDWRLFNMAPLDQQWHQQEQLPKKANYAIWNMHPEHPVQQGNLPDWRVRCFVTRNKQGQDVFEHIELRPTTVWFFPHKQQMLLIYQGSLRINEDDAYDVKHLMLAMEETDHPRDIEHYRTVLQQRLDKEKGALYAFREKDLLPEACIGPWLDTQSPEFESALKRNMENRERLFREKSRQHLLSLGKDPDTFIQDQTPPIDLPPLRMDELPDFIEKTNNIAEKQFQKMEEMQSQQQNKLNQLGLAPFPSPSISSIMDGAAEPDIDNSSMSGYESYCSGKQALTEDSHAFSPLDIEQRQQFAQSLHQLYLMSAHAQKAAPTLTDDALQKMREKVLTILQQDRDFSHQDLTGADLSNLDLSGCNFSHALMEGVTLHNSLCDDANFDYAVLARADLYKSSFCRSSFNQTSLAKSHLYECRLYEACLQETNIEAIVAEYCQFTDATLKNLFFRKAVLLNNSFKQATIEDTFFLELPIKAPDFSYVKGKKISFISCKIEQMDISHAHLANCTMIDTQVFGLNGQYATLIECACVKDSQMVDSDFSYAQLLRTNFRQLILPRANFSHAKLENSDFSEAQLQHANFSFVNGNYSMFIRTDFTRANLQNASLVGAILQKSQLAATDFRQANLFRCDLALSSTSADTKFDEAYLKRVKTVPLRDKEII